MNGGTEIPVPALDTNYYKYFDKRCYDLAARHCEKQRLNQKSIKVVKPAEVLEVPKIQETKKEQLNLF